MKLHDKRTDVTKALWKKPVETSVTPPVTAPVEGGGSSATGDTKRTEQVLGGKVRAEVDESVGVHGAKIGAKLLQPKPKRSWVQTLVKGAIVGIALFAAQPVNTLHADTIFLDHNNAPMEIKAAQQLAAEIHEKFVVVRPDLASLDSLFARAERGEVNIRHLILSGHSTGLRVWGSGEDGTRRETTIDEMRELKAKYPKAFEQIRHVTFMSCYAANAGNSAQWLGVFGNARFLFGFGHSGPAKDRPAGAMMLKTTEHEARKLDSRKLTPQQALVEAKRIAQMPGVNVTTFATRVDGQWYGIGDKMTPADQLEDAVNMLESRGFLPYMNPVDTAHANPPADHQHNIIRDFYTALQTYLGALEQPSWAATQVTNKIETTIRLIYWDKVSSKMLQENAPVFADGLKALQQSGAVAGAPDSLAGKTRLEVVKLADQIQKISTPQFANFATRHADDIKGLESYYQEHAFGDVLVPTVDQSEWQLNNEVTRLQGIVADADASPAAKAAATHLIDALSAKTPESYTKMHDLLTKGLRDLSPDFVPITWID